MRRLHKDYAKIISTVISLSMLGTFFLAACTVNVDRLNDGLSDLGDSLNEAVNPTEIAETEDTEPEETINDIEQVDETEAEPTATPEPTETPTPTPTATPTPTPLPERVDFSELTTDEVTTEFTVYTEDFAEHYVADGTEITLATFEGQKVVVEVPGAANVQTAINLILNGFYSEAEGYYNKYSQKALSSYSLTGDAEDTYDVEVTMSYSENGRLLSVIMSYAVEGADGTVVSSYDFVTFDMLTGQYVTTASITNDIEGLETALGEKLIYAAEHAPEEEEEPAEVEEPEDEDIDENAEETEAEEPEEDEDEDTTETTETTEAEESDETEETVVPRKRINISREDGDIEVTEIFIAAQQAGAETATAEVYGLIDGVIYHTTVDMNEFADYLNTYGTLVYGVSR